MEYLEASHFKKKACDPDIIHLVKHSGGSIML